ncbi:MAG TPA: MlaD family protein [Nitrospirota bacterium]
MKSSRNIAWSELKLGAILLAALVLLAAGILKIGGTGGLFEKRYTLFLKMENTLGLKAGASVRLAGIQVGNVEDIYLPSEPSDKLVTVKLTLVERYKDRIREDSRATLNSLGLLGDKYVDISVGSPQARALEDGETFRGPPESPMSSVFAKASTGIEGLNSVVQELKVVLKDVSGGSGTAGLLLKDPKLYHDLDRAVNNLDAVVAAMRSEKGSFGKFIKEPELYDNLLSVSAKANEVADNLNKGSLAKLSGDPEFYRNLRQVSDNLNEVSESSRALLKNLETGNIAKLSSDKELYAKVQNISVMLDKVMAKLDAGDGTAARLLNDKELYDNMNNFFKDADALALDIKENPDRYVNISIF